MWNCTASSTENTQVMTDQEIVHLVQNNVLQAVEKALESGVEVNTTDSDQRNLLLIATNKSLNEMAKLLVKHGADVNQQALNLDSAFLYAGASGQTELVQL